jgi:hypothetical protein
MRIAQAVAGAVLSLAWLSCGVDSTIDVDDGAPPEEVGSTQQDVSCGPAMSVFPVKGAHNIGYDAASCGTGTCQISCPDQHANSDWDGAGGHHGIDVFAYYRAPLVAVATGTVTAVGVPSNTSGLRVRVRDRCGWEYYYGHMDQAVVSPGQAVSAGQLIGYMGHSGTGSTHCHFNVSPDGNYYSDINPINLLVATSATACQAPPPPPPPPPPGCGRLVPGQQLASGHQLTSCDGRFRLVMQGDGNLVLYQGGVALWNTRTNGRGGARAVQQGDGNFVLYTAGNTALWNSGTQGHGGAWLALQNDGNLVVYSGSTALWSSHTCCR